MKGVGGGGSEEWGVFGGRRGKGIKIALQTVVTASQIFIPSVTSLKGHAHGISLITLLVIFRYCASMIRSTTKYWSRYSKMLVKC